jgi:hypothetical protein
MKVILQGIPLASPPDPPTPRIRLSKDKPTMPSEADKKLQHVLAPVKEHLARVSGANKRKIPNDMTRLEIMKVSLVAIGNHITNHVKQNASLEDSLWKFVSDRYWPQSSKESKRVPSEKLKEMYVKIAGKGAAIKATAPREKIAAEDTAPKTTAPFGILQITNASSPSHKRSFDEFAERLPPFKWGRPYLHNNKPDGTYRPRTDSIKQKTVPNYISALERTPDQPPVTFQMFRLHGVDPEKLISGLTNKIHPVFLKTCCCKYTMDCCRMAHIRFVAPRHNIPLVKVPAIASPAPSDNFFVRTVMQLATRWVLSDPGLQFISALMEYGREGKKFQANPRKLLSTERKQAALRQLLFHAPQVTVHFREFSHLEGSASDKAGLGYTTKQRTAPLSSSTHIVMDVEEMQGYDPSAPNYDQHTVNELIRSIIRTASTLCHEFAHAICFLEVHTLVQLEPKFNNEPFAEAGYAFENFLWGGTLNDSRSDGLWLHRWPPAGWLSAYNDDGVFLARIDPPEAIPMPGGQLVEHEVYERLLDDHFWGSERVEPGKRRRKPFKKTWLRPYHEVPTTAQEWNHFSTGYFPAPRRGNQAKRRRLAGTTQGECPRWEDMRRATLSTSEKSQRVQWLRRKEKMEERREEFNERRLLRSKEFADELDTVVEMLERF